MHPAEPHRISSRPGGGPQKRPKANGKKPVCVRRFGWGYRGRVWLRLHPCTDHSAASMVIAKGLGTGHRGPGLAALGCNQQLNGEAAASRSGAAQPG